MNPRFTARSRLSLGVAALLMVLWILPAGVVFGSPGAADEAGLSPSALLTLEGGPPASLYRPAAPSSEGLLLFADGDTTFWDRVVSAHLERGIAVLVVSSAASSASVHAAHAAFLRELGEDAVVGVAGAGGGTEPAWQLTRTVGAGATLLIEPRGELVPSPGPPVANLHPHVLLLTTEDDFVTRERVRSLYLSADGLADLWLMSGGTSWDEVLARPDLASDLALWMSRTLRESRSSRNLPLARKGGIAK